MFEEATYIKENRFAGVELSPKTKELIHLNPQGNELMRLNRMLLGDTYKLEPDKNLRLTRAAQHGLTLPARGVLDLWQLAYWVAKDHSPSAPKFKAEKVARTMLRNAIQGSEIPSELGHKLQEKVILRTEGGGTNLALLEVELRQIYVLVTDFEISFPILNERTKPPGRYSTKSTLTCYSIEDVIIKLDRDELPPLVGAWLAVLYDILILSNSESESSVQIRELKVPSSVDVLHQVVDNRSRRLAKKTFGPQDWPLPNWFTFAAHEVFRLRWRIFRLYIRKNLPVLKRSSEGFARLLAAGWIACILETFVSLTFPPDELETRKAFAKFAPWKIVDRIEADKEIEKEILEFEKSVIQGAADLYKRIQDVDRKSNIFVDFQHWTETKNWLEERLPLFLSYFYVPGDNGISKNRWQEIMEMKDFHGTDLARHWKLNFPFIIADLQKSIEMFFPRKGKDTLEECHGWQEEDQDCLNSIIRLW